MDTRTGIIVAALMMLLNGGVLGLMHRTLSPEVRPSAKDWRIGTLMMASGCLVLAMQDLVAHVWSLPLGNGLFAFGFTLYWRSVRRFYGLPDSRWLFIPALVTTGLIVIFTSAMPDFGLRVLSTTLLLIFVGAATSYVLWTRKSLVSENVLLGLFATVTVLAVVRAFYYAVAEPAASLLQVRTRLSSLTLITMTALPVIGTTAFLLMCAERARKRWEDAAATDYLTGLPNRRTMTTTGTARFNAARRAHAKLAVALLDVDHFKSVNDNYGHTVGDQALCHIANVLGNHCRGPAMVGRHGGEEFLIIIDDADDAAAMAAGERLRAVIEQTPFLGQERPVTITASVGIAVLQDDDTRFDDLLSRADGALYEAKAAGRNRVVLAT